MHLLVAISKRRSQQRIARLILRLVGIPLIRDLCAHSTGQVRAIHLLDRARLRAQRITPLVRRCRTTARVSISAITGTPYRSRYSSATWVERQFELIGENSRVTNPSI